MHSIDSIGPSHLIDMLISIFGPPAKKVTRSTPDWSVRLDAHHVAYIIFKLAPEGRRTKTVVEVDARSPRGAAHFNIDLQYRCGASVRAFMWHGQPYSSTGGPRMIPPDQVCRWLPSDGSPLDTTIHLIIRVATDPKVLEWPLLGEIDDHFA